MVGADNSPPWHQSTLFWGCVGAVLAVVLTVIAAMLKDLRWLLAVAWPFAAVASWEFARTLKLRGAPHWTAVGTLLSALLLGSLYLALSPNSEQRTADLSLLVAVFSSPLIAVTAGLVVGFLAGVLVWKQDRTTTREVAKRVPMYLGTVAVAGASTLDNLYIEVAFVLFNSLPVRLKLEAVRGGIGVSVLNQASGGLENLQGPVLRDGGTVEVMPESEFMLVFWQYLRSEQAAAVREALEHGNQIALDLRRLEIEMRAERGGIYPVPLWAEVRLQLIDGGLLRVNKLVELTAAASSSPAPRLG